VLHVSSPGKLAKNPAEADEPITAGATPAKSAENDWLASVLDRVKATDGDDRGKPGAPICDWRRGCPLITDVFPENSTLAQLVISSTPHLAEALVRLGMPYSSTTIDMALALQEARHCPPFACLCLATPNTKQL
jgi:hypothetical protein